MIKLRAILKLVLWWENLIWNDSGAISLGDVTFYLTLAWCVLLSNDAMCADADKLNRCYEKYSWCFTYYNGIFVFNQSGNWFCCISWISRTWYIHGVIFAIFIQIEVFYSMWGNAIIQIACLNSDCSRRSMHFFFWNNLCKYARI